MTIKYFLAPNPILSFAKADGTWNVYGKLWTYKATDHNAKKATYQDPGGLLEYANPIRLDGVGSVGPIYLADDELYYLKLTTYDDQLITDVDNYPITKEGGGGPPITVEVDYDNQVINGQFRFHNAKTLFPFAAGAYTPIAAYWRFYKDNATAEDAIYFKEMDFSDSVALEGSPRYFLRYECTSAGTGEADKKIYTHFSDVRSFSGKEVSVAIVARSASPLTITMSGEQFFGSGGGGSPNVVTPIGPFTTTTLFTKYTVGTVVIPTIVGKNIGPGKDDELWLAVNCPLNQICQLDIVNVQLNLGSQVLVYQMKTHNRELMECIGSQLIPREQYEDPFDADGSSIYFPHQDRCIGRNSAVLYPWGRNSFTFKSNVIPAGTCDFWWSDESVTGYPPSGWRVCNGVTDIPKCKYPELYDVIEDKYTPPDSVDTANATVLSNVVTVEMRANGAVQNAADIDTGFTIATVVEGSPTTKEKFTVTCTSASSLKGGESFTFETPALKTWYVHMIIDGNYLKIPTGDEHIYVWLNSYDDAATVALKLHLILDHFVYAPPQTQGYVLRCRDFWTGVDPDRDLRLARPDGTTGNRVGTIQLDEFKAHFHTYEHYSGLATATGGTFTDIWSGSDADDTSTVGGSETRMKNVYVIPIIKL